MNTVLMQYSGTDVIPSEVEESPLQNLGQRKISDDDFVVHSCLLFSAQCGRRGAVSSLPPALAPVPPASFSLPKRVLFLAPPSCPTWLAPENPVATSRRCKNEIGARLQPHRDVWAKATPVY